MLFAFSDRSAHQLIAVVAVDPRYRDIAPREYTTSVPAVPARETDASTVFPASVAAEPRPHGAYSREETYRKERA
jgi:hypothetical protein